METVGNQIDKISKVLEWLPKIVKFFKPFRPEVTHLQINYKNQTASLNYKLDIDPGVIRRKIGKIEIPRLENYKIVSFYGDGFCNLTNLIKLNEKQNAYYIPTNSLPSCRAFQISLSGKINPGALDDIIRIQPAINKDNTVNYDKYWLNVMIKDIGILEQIYQYLEIDDVICPVTILIERYFTTGLPKSLTEGIKAVNEFLAAGRGLDRHKLFQKWRRYRQSLKRDKQDLLNYFEELLKKLDLKQYIKIDEPFFTGKIGDFERYNIIPNNFTVDAITDLSFKKPAASGYLKFNKKQFQETVKTEITENWE